MHLLSASNPRAPLQEREYILTETHTGFRAARGVGEDEAQARVSMPLSPYEAHMHACMLWARATPHAPSRSQLTKLKDRFEIAYHYLIPYERRLHITPKPQHHLDIQVPTRQGWRGFRLVE